MKVSTATERRFTRFLAWLCLFVAISAFAMTYDTFHPQDAYAQKKPNRKPARGKGRRKSQTFNLGGTQISGRYTQPQAIYLVNKTVFDLDVPKPKHDPVAGIWDTVYLDLFEP